MEKNITSPANTNNETKNIIHSNVKIILLYNFELIGTYLYKNHFVDMYKSHIDVDLEKVVLQKGEVCDIKFVTEEEFLEMANDNKKSRHYSD